MEAAMCEAPVTLVSRAHLITLARSLVTRRVRWKHQGVRPDTGMDCGGLVRWLAQACGLFDLSVRAYRRDADGVTLEAACREVLDDLPSLQAVRPGDVLTFDDHGRYPCHVALAADGAEPFSLIHATPLARRVVEQRFDAYWRDTWRRAFTWRAAYPSGRGVAPWPS